MRRRTKKLLKLLIPLILVTAVLLALTGNLPSGMQKWVDKNMPATVTKTVSDIKGKISDTSKDGLNILQQALQDYMTTPKTPEGLELPSAVGNNQIVVHNGYTLSYNEKYEQPDWVAYVLTVEELNTNNASRSEDFREDPAVTTQSAHLDDYRNSGYDRGHLCPSADRTATAEENSETFFLSNMSPQIHRFNAGLWLKAESAVRDAARQFGTVYVATGPVFSKNMKTIGECNVAVPESFYKVILATDANSETHAIGIVCPQEYDNGNLKPYLCSVDEVEKLTGIDFFPVLDDSIEDVVEAVYNSSVWPSSFQK